MTLRLLMFGRSGQVATEVLRHAGPGVAVTALGRADADLSDPAACAECVRRADVEVVLNAAAYTAVDRAESEEGLATVINAEAPGAMARAAAERGLPFLHISTDYVFDGRGDRPWAEDDPVGPLSAYGRSKLAGERAVAAAGGRHVILRTSWVHAGHGANFVRTMLRLGAERPRLSVVDDQFGGPTPAGHVAKALWRISRAFMAGQAQDGIFHLSGAPATTWCGFAREIFRQAPLTTRPEVVAIGTQDWPTPAVRPRNSVLDSSKIERVYGIAQPDWRSTLGGILSELAEGSR